MPGDGRFGPKLVCGPVRRSEPRTVGGVKGSLADQSEPTRTSANASNLKVLGLYCLARIVAYSIT